MENQKDNLVLRKGKQREVEAQSSMLLTRCIDTAKIKPSQNCLRREVEHKMYSFTYKLRHALELIEKDLEGVVKVIFTP